MADNLIRFDPDGVHVGTSTISTLTDAKAAMRALVSYLRDHGVEPSVTSNCEITFIQKR